MKWTRLAATLALAAALPASVARADAGQGSKAVAQALFEQGCELLEHGHVAEACPKLAESQRLDPGTGTLLWLGDCLEQNGQTASAWAAFSEAASGAAAAHDTRERVAQERVQRLASKLSRLMIAVPQAAASQGLVVQRDGTALGAAEWGTPLPVDPGVHTVSASAPGRAAWSTSVQVPSVPGTLQVTIPVLDPLPAEPAPIAPVPAPEPTPVLVAPTPASSLAPTSPAPAAPAPSSSAALGTQRILGLAASALGLVGVGVGTYFALRAKSTYDGAVSDGHCSTSHLCDATGLQERSDAYSQATVATVAVSLGAVALVGGGVLYFTAPSERAFSVGVTPSARGAATWVSMRW